MTSNIQMIVLGVFIFFLIVGVVVFSAFGGSGSKTAVTNEVIIWGTLPATVFESIKNAANGAEPGSMVFSYVEIREESFDQTLIEALAEGTGPDLILIPDNFLYKHQKKLSVVGYDIFSERDFKDSFIEGSEVLLTTEGTYGFPVVADPLVMYWNRDILNSKGIAKVPETWEEMIASVSTLTELSSDRKILKSAIAFGDSVNVPYTKEIVAALMMQAGSRLVIRDGVEGVQNLIRTNVSVSPSDTAFTFFTQFADPLKSLYSWNRSLPSSEDYFLAGNLAFYFAPASRAADLRAKNPNLNFDIAAFPQPKNTTIKKTSGTIYAFSILTSSPYKQEAFSMALTLSSPAFVKAASDLTGLPPARRDLLVTKPGTAFGDVFFESALLIRTWLDPDPVLTRKAFNDAVDSVVTGKIKTAESGSVLGATMDEILKLR